MNRLRSAIKPGQDFSRTSRQKTCPYGPAESEDCHSASVPLRCTPSERQYSSRQQYPRLRPGYEHPAAAGCSLQKPTGLFAYRSRGLETFAFLLRQILRTPRFHLRRKSLRSYARFPSSESQKTPAGQCPRPHRGE